MACLPVGHSPCQWQYALPGSQRQSVSGVPEDFYARLASEASERSIRVVLDTSGPALEPTLNAGVYLAKLNRKELSQMGYSGDWRAESQLAFMAELVQAGAAELLVVTQGDQGALMATASGEKLRAIPSC